MSTHAGSESSEEKLKWDDGGGGPDLSAELALMSLKTGSGRCDMCAACLRIFRDALAAECDEPILLCGGAGPDLSAEFALMSHKTGSGRGGI